MLKVPNGSFVENCPLPSVRISMGLLLVLVGVARTFEPPAGEALSLR